jgi:hypothetical protein
MIAGVEVCESGCIFFSLLVLNSNTRQAHLRPALMSMDPPLPDRLSEDEDFCDNLVCEFLEHLDVLRTFDDDSDGEPLLESDDDRSRDSEGGTKLPSSGTTPLGAAPTGPPPPSPPLPPHLALVGSLKTGGGVLWQKSGSPCPMCAPGERCRLRVRAFGDTGPRLYHYCKECDSDSDDWRGVMVREVRPSLSKTQLSVKYTTWPDTAILEDYNRATDAGLLGMLREHVIVGDHRKPIDGCGKSKRLKPASAASSKPATHAFIKYPFSSELGFTVRAALAPLAQLAPVDMELKASDGGPVFVSWAPVVDQAAAALAFPMVLCKLESKSTQPFPSSKTVELHNVAGGRVLVACDFEFQRGGTWTPVVQGALLIEDKLQLFDGQDVKRFLSLRSGRPTQGQPSLGTAAQVEKQDEIASALEMKDFSPLSNSVVVFSPTEQLFGLQVGG